MNGKITIIGIGPGDKSMITEEVKEEIKSATEIIGYKKYLERLKPDRNINFYPSDNRNEIERAVLAFELATKGKNVLIVSSGDPGIFAMSAVVFETLENGPLQWFEVDIKVLPGITSMLAASARIGAPLGNDFCVINLSNNLKPWSLIKQRIISAIKGDFVTVLYNPRSLARPNTFLKTLKIFREHCKEDRFIIFARSVSTKNEKIEVVSLKEASETMADMQTLVIIGSSFSRVFHKKLNKIFYTPRSIF